MARAPKLWKAGVTVPAAALAAFDAALSDALEEFALPVASRELTFDGPWRCEVYGEGAPPHQALKDAVKAAAAAARIAPPRLAVVALPRRNWAADNQRAFKPFRVGPFWVHPTHVERKPPRGSIPLAIDAGLAFGTGEHETTRGCLELIARLDPKRALNPVDVGCGTGILAAAMAKLWNRPIAAGDNDPEAVEVAQANAELNGVAHLVDPVVSDGVAAPALKKRTPYDLIVANILAGPLVELAPSFAKAAAPRATVILSGLLDEQRAAVVAAYRKQGFRLAEAVEHGDDKRGHWRALRLTRTLRKNRAK